MQQIINEVRKDQKGLILSLYTWADQATAKMQNREQFIMHSSVVWIRVTVKDKVNMAQCYHTNVKEKIPQQ